MKERISDLLYNFLNGISEIPPIARECQVAAGRLVIPFDFTLPMQLAFFFLCPQVAAERPKIVAFRDWLLEESHRASAAAGEPSHLPKVEGP